MKRSIILFALLISFLAVKAQIKPVYLVGDSLVLDSTKATSYGIFGKLSNEDFYRIKVYDLYDNLLLTGAYKDDKMQVPIGRFVYYAFVDDFNYDYDTNFYIKGSSRYLSKQGEFLDGMRVGRWVEFFPDGKFLSIENYVNGLKNGKYQMFTKRGKVEIEGNYVEDRKDGTWVYDTGKIEFYTNGILVSTRYN